MKKIKCPTCQKETVWDRKNSFRPFCCERCRLIDLGDWANESHQIPGSELVSKDDIDLNSGFYGIENDGK